MQDALFGDNTKYITVIEVVQQIYHVSENKTNFSVLFDVDAFGVRECDWWWCDYMGCSIYSPPIRASAVTHDVFLLHWPIKIKLTLPSKK